MSWLIMWIVMTLAIYGVFLFAVVNEGLALPLPHIYLLGTAAGIAAFMVANEMRRPEPREYNCKKALYPKVPEQLLHDNPIPESVYFGRDYHTNKLIMASPGHTIIVGSTGSGKTATALIPSILSCTGGSKQICDIKSRELAYKTADISNPKTQIIDLNLRADYIYGWDILYKLKKDGSDTEQVFLQVIREVAAIIIPKTKSGDSFWSDAARNEFIGLSIYEYIYKQNYEFIDIVNSFMTIPLREHMDTALNTVKKTSLVASYLTGLASTADETLFSVDISLQQNLFIFLENDIIYFLRDNPKRANPAWLNHEGYSQYLCVDEEKLDSGYDKIMNIVMKETVLEILSRNTSGTYPQTMLYYDEFQKLTEKVESMRELTASFLKTARSKHCSMCIAVQNLDNFDKQLIYDLLANCAHIYVLASNNANSLTTEIVCKTAGTYYEKSKNYSEGKSSSVSTSFSEKQVLKPEDLNQLGESGVLIISNYGYVRTNKEKTAYYKTEPFKTQYEKILAVNKEAMKGV